MFESWVAMEKFYFKELWIIIAIVSFILFTIIPMIFYLNKRKPQLIVGSCAVIVAVLGIYIYFEYSKYSDLIQRTVYTSPAMRSYGKDIFVDIVYLPGEKRAYMESYLKNSFEKIGLYDAYEEKENIEFFGKNDHYYFLKVRDEFLLTRADNVQFKKVDNPYRIGTYFKLKDPKFEDIGFYEKSKVYFDKYIVPEEMKDLKVDKKYEDISSYKTRTVGTWIIP
ncbi:MAG: hypothetical protein Q4P34_02590 [Tissierellia bacterium]|nr:hypothetical protein [Tissierellia bacterium]